MRIIFKNKKLKSVCPTKKMVEWLTIMQTLTLCFWELSNGIILVECSQKKEEYIFVYIVWSWFIYSILCLHRGKKPKYSYVPFSLSQLLSKINIKDRNIKVLFGLCLLTEG